MGHSLALLNNGEPRKVGLMEGILPKESTPNLEERRSVHTDGRTRALIWWTKLLCIQGNVSWICKWLAQIKATVVSGANLVVQIKPWFRRKTVGREGRSVKHWAVLFLGDRILCTNAFSPYLNSHEVSTVCKWEKDVPPLTMWHLQSGLSSGWSLTR